MSNDSILFYDSGVGGLTTLKETFNFLPNENYIYFADDKNCPYGNLSQEEIIKLIKDNLSCVLKQRNIKMLVFACNTATTCCVREFRRDFGVDIVGIEPAVLPAMKASEKKKVLVIATHATFNQNKYKELERKIGGKVVRCGLSFLARDIERWVVCKEEFDFEKYVQVLREIAEENDTDALVLGCTHYVFYKNAFKERLKINVFDGNKGVARRIRSILENKGGLNEQKSVGNIEFILSSNDKNKKEEYKGAFEGLKIEE